MNRSRSRGRSCRRVLGILAALAALSPLPLAGHAQASVPEANCFWLGPFDRTQLDDPEVNVAYPDKGAGYWAARFNLPPGARMVLEGRFPHARYLSLNAYRDGGPIDTLTDVAIEPRRGGVNPFVPGARRGLGRSRREWKVKVLDQPAPDREGARAPNTLYAESGGGVQELIYRVYVPDRGRGSKAGGGLPRPVVVLADGTRLKRRAACRAVNDPDRELPSLTVPVPVYEGLVKTPGADYETTPAFSPLRWEAFFNFAYALSVYKVGTPSEPERDALDKSQVGGQYSNGDARYTVGPINRAHGGILVLRGKMPTFPRTRDGARRMKGGEVRYWSLCQNESPVTTSVISCRYDEQVPLDKRRRYTIVVGTAADRPPDATRRCGVAWLRWGHSTDALGRTGGGTLLMRNIRPDPSFDEAIQNVTEPGDEWAVMGRYLPRGEYMDPARFIAPRCPLQ